MVFDVLGNLAADSIRGLARNLFPGFYERGVSANQALKELREMGLGYRRQDFLNDFRVGESSWTQEIKIRFVGENKTPSEGILYPQYHGVPDKYSLVFKASGIDPTTGDEATSYFYQHRNSLDTRANLEQDASSYYSEGMGERGSTPELEDITISVVEGYINPLWA